MRPQRFRPPSSDALLILLCAVVGMVTVCAVVGAIIFAAKTNELSNQTRTLSERTSELAARTSDLAINTSVDAAKTKAALCTLRMDLHLRADDQQRRVREGEKFLRDHPNGIPGIPAALLRQSIDSQRATLEGQRRTAHALSSLDC